MEFSLSTRWNAERHESGEALVEEILELGFTRIELSYDLTLDLVPGVRKMVKSGAVCVSSVHAFCPVPVGAPSGHPELFSLTDPFKRSRESGVLNTLKTVTFAAEMGAPAVVSHAGRVEMRARTSKLLDLIERDQQYTPRYDKMKFKLLDQRARKAGKHIDALCQSIEELLPDLEENKVCLAFENLPYWEAVPSELEMQQIFNQFDSPWIGYWHDFGHGQIRENLGFTSHKVWVEQLQSRLVGMHIHDVQPPATDHLMPPRGSIDFSIFKDAANSGITWVLEPMPDTPGEDVKEAVRTLRQAWGDMEKDTQH